MIDLTNYDHKRGVMILTSKDVRTVDNALFDWKVHTGCIANYAEMISTKINRSKMSDDDKAEINQYIEFIKNWIEQSSGDIEKARDIFR